MADEQKKKKQDEENTCEGCDCGCEPEQDEHADCKQQVEEYKNQYLRAIADYRNYERRVYEEQEQQKERIKADVINKLLPFLDNVEKAEVFIKDPGLQMIKDQFIQTIKQLGVEEVALEGTEFDPHTAEAVDVEAGKQDNIVMKVLRKAYKLNGKIIQHGLVTVSKKA